LKDGSTFVPLGAESNCTLGDTTFFNGTFNGLGHSISHFRFEAENDVNIGLFRGLGDSGSIVSLKLISPSVRGADNVGAFLGNAEAGGALSWLTVENGDVEGNHKVGMIAGVANSGALKSSLHATGKVRGDGNHIGGLIGQAGTDMISQASFAGEVISESGEFVGGIAGQSGSIFEAVVSGYVKGANNIGGIAGQATQITDARVTATVIGTMDTPNTVHGGIAGSGNVENAMFFGSFYSYSTSNGNVGIISGDGTGLDTYSSLPLASRPSVGFGVAPNLVGTSASASASWDQICGSGTVWNCRDLNSDSAPDTGEGMDLPRLAFESHPCMQQANLDTVEDQEEAGRGDSTNPIRLCRIEQINEINTYPGLHYSLLQDIAINNITSPGIVSGSFTGTFNGNGHALHGLVYNPAANYGLFGSISSTGVVRNLKLYNFRLDSSNSGLSLIGDSAGLIENIETKFIILKAPSGVGGLVRMNSGTIRNVEVEGMIYGDTSVGGIAAFNSSTIEDVVSRVSMSSYDGLSSGTTDTDFGGIVGTNTSIIRRAQFDGRIESYLVTWDVKRVGGLVGANIGGSISDSVVTRQAHLNLSSGITEAGTLIGFHNSVGTLTRLLAETLLIHPSASDYGIKNLSATIGSISGSYTEPASFASYGAVATFVGSALAAVFDESGGVCSAINLSSLALIDSTSYIIAPDYSNNFLPTAMDFSTNNGNTLSFIGIDQNFCSEFDGSIRAFEDGGAAIYPRTFAQLSSAGYSIVNHDTGTDAEKKPLFEAHIAHMKGLPLPANRPVWVFEEGEYQLFRVDK
jgi:hypothetical protein